MLLEEKKLGAIDRQHGQHGKHMQRPKPGDAMRKKLGKGRRPLLNPLFIHMAQDDAADQEKQIDVDPTPGKKSDAMGEKNLVMINGHAQRRHTPQAIEGQESLGPFLCALRVGGVNGNLGRGYEDMTRQPGQASLLQSESASSSDPNLCESHTLRICHPELVEGSAAGG